MRYSGKNVEISAYLTIRFEPTIRKTSLDCWKCFHYQPIIYDSVIAPGNGTFNA